MKTKITIGLCLLLSISSTKAQVTIGSATPPNKGALLDLKDGTGTGDATATKGMMLPRVKLSDLKKLKMGTTEILDTDDGGGQYEKHIGLCVYNVSDEASPKCLSIPDGIYIWDGVAWQAISVAATPRTIEQWANRAGFTRSQINTVKTTGADSPILQNGIQLHRDQSNNLYLSSNFGTNATDSDERWMIHNLAATQFDTNVTYTGGADVTDNALIPYSDAGSGAAATNKAYKNPYFCYPNGKASGSTTTDYDNNPRLGLLYTWDAATGGKGGKTGQGGAEEGEQVPSSANKVQGICPNGWHLPNNYELTMLENRFISNTKDFSSTNNIGGTLLDPTNASTDGWRAPKHGKAMKEICEPSDASGMNQGTSNSINTTDRPGFDVFLAGNASSGKAYAMVAGNLWSSSTGSTSSAWYRRLAIGLSTVFSGREGRDTLFSVRCKKD